MNVVYVRIQHLNRLENISETHTIILYQTQCVYVIILYIYEHIFRIMCTHTHTQTHTIMSKYIISNYNRYLNNNIIL